MRSDHLILTIGLIMTFSSYCQGKPESKNILLAGTSKVNITPTTEPVHDSIYARCLVLDVNGKRLAFVSVDLPDLSGKRLKEVCKEKYGITELLLCASHNHSAPFRFSPTDYSAFFEKQVLKSVDLATRNMFEARISAGRKRFPQLGFKRLILREDGHARESWFGDDQISYLNRERIPYGPVDDEVGVIKIEDINGQARVIMMNYACHADAICDSYEVSADYPGAAAKKVEEAFDHKVNCLFVNGAGGNVAPLFSVPRRHSADDPFQTDYAPVERMGELLAYQTVKVARSISSKSNETTIKYKEDSLRFTGRYDKTLNFDVHIATILINDDIVIAACPGELFVKLGLNWKKEMQEEVQTPMFFGYTWTGGKSPGYVADIKGAAEGGYGADMSADLIEVGAGEKIVNRQYENYFKLDGLMLDQPRERWFNKRGPRWTVTLTE